MPILIALGCPSVAAAAPLSRDVHPIGGTADSAGDPGGDIGDEECVPFPMREDCPEIDFAVIFVEKVIDSDGDLDTTEDQILGAESFLIDVAGAEIRREQRSESGVEFVVVLSESPTRVRVSEEQNVADFELIAEQCGAMEIVGDIVWDFGFVSDFENAALEFDIETGHVVQCQFFNAPVGQGHAQVLSPHPDAPPKEARRFGRSSPV